MSAGIDYGMGKTNIDTETGIRFGVISQNELLQAWCDSAEPEYGAPHCPQCGNEAQTGESKSEQRGNSVTCWTEHPPEAEDYDTPHGCCGDYRCDECRILFDGEDAFGDEPLGHVLDDGEYKATQSGDDSDIFILKSPYFTRCRYCSPCAPGAGHLTSCDDDGIRAYCFGHDWFYDDEHESAPYPVFCVATGELLSEPINVDGETRWIAKKQ